MLIKAYQSCQTMSGYEDTDIETFINPAHVAHVSSFGDFDRVFFRGDYTDVTVDSGRRIRNALEGDLVDEIERLSKKVKDLEAKLTK